MPVSSYAFSSNNHAHQQKLCRAAQNLPFDIFERIIPLIETVDLRRVSTISREFENLCLNELLRRIRFKEPESDYIIAGRYYRSLQYHEENREELLSLPLYSRAKNHRVPLNYLSVELSQNPDNAREDLKALTCFLQVNRLPTNAVSVYLLKTTGQSDYEDFILALRDAKTSFLNLGGHSTCIDFFDMDIDNPLLVNGLATDSFDHLRAVTIRTALVFSNGLSYHTVPLLCSPRLSNLCLDIVELEDSQWDAILSSITSQLQTFEVAGEVSFRTIAKFLSFQPNLQDLSIRSYLPLVASKISFSAAETVSGLPRNTRILGNLNKLTGSVGTILKVLSLIDPSTSPLKTITIQPSSSPSVFSFTALDSLQHMLKNFKVFALYIHIREVRQLKEIRRFKYSDIQQSERVRIRERERSATQVGIQEIYLYMVAQYDSYFFVSWTKLVKCSD